MSGLRRARQPVRCRLFDLRSRPRPHARTAADDDPETGIGLAGTPPTAAPHPRRQTALAFHAWLSLREAAPAPGAILFLSASAKTLRDARRGSAPCAADASASAQTRASPTTAPRLGGLRASLARGTARGRARPTLAGQPVSRFPQKATGCRGQPRSSSRALNRSFGTRAINRNRGRRGG